MQIDKFKKIVIKIGSSILIDKEGKPKRKWLKEFAQDIKNLIRKKKQVVIVCSWEPKENFETVWSTREIRISRGPPLRREHKLFSDFIINALRYI